MPEQFSLFLAAVFWAGLDWRAMGIRRPRETIQTAPDGALSLWCAAIKTTSSRGNDTWICYLSTGRACRAFLRFDKQAAFTVVKCCRTGAGWHFCRTLLQHRLWGFDQIPAPVAILAGRYQVIAPSMSRHAR
jgi:hypothetical protein